LFLIGEPLREKREKDKLNNRDQDRDDIKFHRSTDSRIGFWWIVSLTAENTGAIFVMSIAIVKLRKKQKKVNKGRKVKRDHTYCAYMVKCDRFACMNFERMYLAAFVISEPP
jgi:hypothetical protein